MNAIYLTGDEVLVAGSIACSFDVEVRDRAQFEANVARPGASAFGDDAYPGVWAKAASLMHGFATTQCLIDGNKRTAWAAAWMMLRINGSAGYLDSKSLDDDEAERFVLRVAAGDLTVDEVAAGLRRLNSSNRLPIGFKMITPPVEVTHNMLIGNGRLADGSPRIYVYALMDDGVPCEWLLTAEQAREMAWSIGEALNGSPEPLRVAVERLIRHGDIDDPPRA